MASHAAGRCIGCFQSKRHQAGRRAALSGCLGDLGPRLKVPTPGAVMVQSRPWRPCHAYLSEDAKYYYCRGGDQSDSVNVTNIPKSRVTKAIRWPVRVPLPTADRKMGATGRAVKEPPAPKPNYATITSADGHSGKMSGDADAARASNFDCSSSSRLSINPRSRSVSSVVSSRRYL